MNKLVHRIYEVHALNEQIKHAEKSRLAALNKEAQTLFTVSNYSQYSILISSF